MGIRGDSQCNSFPLFLYSIRFLPPLLFHPLGMPSTLTWMTNGPQAMGSDIVLIYLVIVREPCI